MEEDEYTWDSEEDEDSDSEDDKYYAKLEDEEHNVEEYYAKASFALGIRGPTQTDTPLNAPVISRLRSEAEELNKSIHELKTQLAALQDRLEAIEEQLSTVVYPINTVPPEIMCRIFAAAVSLSPPAKVPVILLRITSVSQRWRAIAIAEPHLWTNASFFLKREKSSPLFELFLQRAQGLPIIVSTPRARLPRDLFDSTARWKEADLDAISLGFKCPISGFDFPHLTKLTLKLSTAPQSDLRSTFQKAIHLQELSINNPQLVSQLSIPIQQLRKLTILSNWQVSYFDVISLLPELVALEELSLIADFVGIDDASTLIMPFLSTLSLLGENTASLLADLTLPSLSSLHLSYFHWGEARKIIHECLSRSLANVTSLDLSLINSGSYSTDYSTIRVLLFSPSFDMTRELILPLLELDSRHSKLLAADLARLDFLPNLEIFTLVVPHPSRYRSSMASRPSPVKIELRPFLDGLAMRVANALSTGHTMKLSQFVIEHAPHSFCDEDMYSLRNLQHHLQIKVAMPHGYFSNMEFMGRLTSGA
ncbi:hypothetical protein MIND_00797500 [Mycena indigotica]|uniref:F-box/LRR-repeat protein 15/At3g58940/PEG3-like LRR domain-containing protein n=1 Tax=Mycena indigotica TaxID=2126181 RepID=A0A8H6SM46_9AGAR|nr:uncharacterized protein MIND_00797500 [Mycena indigotica]KAF7302300.1 hypothetical protein MIND_00797500 [Mycena indigotica]